MAANGTPGAGVDAQGRPVFDPTPNVISILESAVKRQDDLREAEVEHSRQRALLHASYQKELREAESARIDAIRAVDVGAVQRAAEVAATQAETLRQQVAVSAETLRTQVAAAATAAQTSQTNALAPIQKDIADLRQAQYEGVGQKTQVIESQAELGGQRQSVGIWIAAAAASSAFFLGIAGVIVAVLVSK